jgi:hypothetical protein
MFRIFAAISRVRIRTAVRVPDWVSAVRRGVPMVPGRPDGGRHSRLIRHAVKLGQQNPTVKQILHKPQKISFKRRRMREKMQNVARFERLLHKSHCSF